MFVSIENCSSIEQVQEQCPGAVHIEQMDGGGLVFDSSSDYDTWAGQI
ncbi:MAG: hypothetical protein IBX55_13945 [Methyloprofundus sp.]|nr:hypothetical protein [Methyloprofundus sp.]